MPDVNRRTVLAGSAGLLLLSACGRGKGGAHAAAGPLTVSAIPDQDPERLHRLYSSVADRFAKATKLRVAYRPVTDYTAVVRAFEVGDVQMAWMGGLTGVQARNRVRGA